ncbi:phosphohistidine phosphatase SixA [Stutzerimonas azotifigens]|uniref:phosphohistidine phosphatase SixA n=1 Tax=Stutzerimonas azotifigens TaxID=291995 RepID=UPI00042274A6|nr:phosphohistidine phosphatase SixA [Stutzerimonas azotifigens]
MKLWLLRHGQAEPRARSDAERNLTDIGRLEARRSAVHLQGCALDVVLASPYVRAQQTAEEACRAIGYEGAFETVPWVRPESDLREAMLYLDRRPEQNLLIVTHQPFVGLLGGWLVHGHRDNPLPMATGSLAELEGEACAAGLMHLVALRHPGR